MYAIIFLLKNDKDICLGDWIVLNSRNCLKYQGCLHEDLVCHIGVRVSLLAYIIHGNKAVQWNGVTRASFHSIWGALMKLEEVLGGLSVKCNVCAPCLALLISLDKRRIPTTYNHWFQYIRLNAFYLSLFSNESYWTACPIQYINWHLLFSK